MRSSSNRAGTRTVKKSTRSSLPASDDAHSRRHAAIRMADQAKPPSPRVSFLQYASPRVTTTAHFRKTIWKFYEKHGRHDLPWRKTRDPYKILVSEVMLQQTQVERVIPFYKNFLKKFPTVRSLASAPLSEVLIAWQGLGYNRRAKMLHSAAKEIVKKYKGIFPKTVEELEELPGIGSYTARAVAAFAYNQDVVFVETNLRTVAMHYFFASRTDISDKEILAVLAQAYPKESTKAELKTDAARAFGAREWYSALMDYGAHLKRAGVRINKKSASYSKQSQFSGSSRQARGAILKALVLGPRQADFLIELLGPDRKDQLISQLASMTKEGMIELKGKKFQLPQ